MLDDAHTLAGVWHFSWRSEQARFMYAVTELQATGIFGRCGRSNEIVQRLVYPPPPCRPSAAFSTMHGAEAGANGWPTEAVGGSSGGIGGRSGGGIGGCGGGGNGTREGMPTAAPERGAIMGQFRTKKACNVDKILKQFKPLTFEISPEKQLRCVVRACVRAGLRGCFVCDGCQVGG